MKLSKEALVEIVDIVRQGIIELTDVSEKLRQLDLVVDGESNTLKLTQEYYASKGRGEV